MAQILLQLFHTIFHLTDFLREADEFLVMVENIFLQCLINFMITSLWMFLAMSLMGSVKTLYKIF